MNTLIRLTRACDRLWFWFAAPVVIGCLFGLVWLISLVYVGQGESALATSVAIAVVLFMVMFTVFFALYAILIMVVMVGMIYQNLTRKRAAA